MARKKILTIRRSGKTTRSANHARGVKSRVRGAEPDGARAETTGRTKPPFSSSTIHTERPSQMGTEAVEHILGPNPVVGLRNEDLVDTTKLLVGQAIKRPFTTLAHGFGFAAEVSRIFAGDSKTASATKDRRFQDPTWQENAFYRALLQIYLSADKELKDWLEDIHLEREDKRRAEFVLSLLTDALAPSNSVLNPAALKRLIETGGASATRGVRHLVDDVRYNRGLPAQVDKTAFRVGQNLATTPGAVVFRSEILELIQYRPTTETVSARPLLLVPPQINKFYIFDLSPKKSLVRYAIAQGLQVFMISWRNPTPKQRDWGLDRYVAAVDEAIDVLREITGHDDCNIMGACSGGITTVALLGYHAAQEVRKVNALTLMVSMFDMSTEDKPLGLFATEEAIEFARQRSHQKGVLEGAEMARIFAWLRPNDLIWNYWVNNYLLGNKPPAFDVLYWNSDTTRLPAELHSDFLTIYQHNPMARAGKLSVLDTPIDLSQVDCDFYSLSGITDHITPWEACYRSTRLLGGRREFVLSNSGHIQSILNPPGNPDATFFTNGESPVDATTWYNNATKHAGSWWEHWKDWILARSGGQKEAPSALGNQQYIPSDKAPGTYVFE